jgi:nucleotide-binding universal stress UspA family protein
MKTILVPIDLSATTASVCEAAASLAKATGAKLVLFHVVQAPVITSDYGIASENLDELVLVSEKSAVSQLEALRQKYSAPEFTLETLQVTGAPGLLILEEAKRLSADYIVMGSHGHSAIYDLLVGTTTHAVLRRATCPILIIPSLRKR